MTPEKTTGPANLWFEIPGPQRHEFIARHVFPAMTRLEKEGRLARWYLDACQTPEDDQDSYQDTIYLFSADQASNLLETLTHELALPLNRLGGSWMNPLASNDEKILIERFRSLNGFHLYQEFSWLDSKVISGFLATRPDNLSKRERLNFAACLATFHCDCLGISQDQRPAALRRFVKSLSKGRDDPQAWLDLVEKLAHGLSALEIHQAQDSFSSELERFVQSQRTGFELIGNRFRLGFSEEAGAGRVAVLIHSFINLSMKRIGIGQSVECSLFYLLASQTEKASTLLKTR
jgi:hypothetical protein